MNLHRRNFIKLSALAAFGVASTPVSSWAKATSRRLSRPDELIDYDSMGLEWLY